MFCQYDSQYYKQSNYGFKYFEEGEYDKSIQAFSLIPDSLLRYKDFIILLNMYNNRDDTANLKMTIAQYAKGNNYCEKIYGIQSLGKYNYLITNNCHNQYDSLYKVKYASIKHIISFLDTSILYSNRFRSEKILDSTKISNLDRNAYLFLSNMNMKETASALRCITQKDYGIYLNFLTTLIHLNYYDSTSSKQVENWSKELMYYGILEPKDYAYIVDRRICIRGNAKQKYGEHFWNYHPQEVKQININREEIGLLPKE